MNLFIYLDNNKQNNMILNAHKQYLSFITLVFSINQIVNSNIINVTSENLNQIFHKYGNGSVITRDGLEKLYLELDKGMVYDDHVHDQTHDHPHVPTNYKVSLNFLKFKPIPRLFR